MSKGQPKRKQSTRKAGKNEIEMHADFPSEVGQIRLAELSVFNWGSFNELHTAKIDPGGTLITGDNGSGKSTLVDGLMALLLPAGKATFNVAAAQGDRSDRTLLSYMRGSFGSSHDGAGTRVRSKRESAVLTGLRACYRGDDSSAITLAALFWTTQSTNNLADVKRLYIVARRDLRLKELLDGFGQGNVRGLKQWLRDDPAITCCDDNFSNYQELYRRLLQMDNKNAPFLLSRALGLKKIDDLTKLIRDLVLEPSRVKEDARKAVAEFDDLVAIHSQLVDARAQKEHLERLPKLDVAIKKSTEKLTTLSAERAGLPVYIGEVSVQLWNERIEAIQGELEKLEYLVKQAAKEGSDRATLVERRHEEYLHFGGDRIESLLKEIKHCKQQLQKVIRDSSAYQETANTLALNPQLEETIFNQNRISAESGLVDTENLIKDCQDQFAEIRAQFNHVQELLKDTGEEIEEIRLRPDSNIPVRYQKLRDELVSSLDLQKDRCVFIGELIDVHDEEKQWQGAIERALGGLRMTLAVPHEKYSMVTRWLNARHTGLHVRVQVVDMSRVRRDLLPQFKDNGYLKKLVWRDHPYQEWLKHHLFRFELQCVTTIEELDRTPFSMTQQGLVHMNKGRFEKKDLHKVDARRHWSLGFSNKSRLALLEYDRKRLEKALTKKQKEEGNARKTLDASSERKEQWKKILNYGWDDINAPYWQERTRGLEKDLEGLLSSGGDLDKARERWEEAKADLAKIRERQQELALDKGGLNTSLREAEKHHKLARSMAAAGLSAAVRKQLEARVGELGGSDLERMGEIIADLDKKLDRLLEKSRNRKNSAEKSVIGIMSSFKGNEKWQVHTVEWACDIVSLPDYLHHLKQLEEEGLPNLVEQFTSRLNKHTTQSLARIKTKLESEREDVLERTDVINKVLERTEFKAGSYLRLGSKKEKFPHVISFERQLRKVLSQVTSDDHESRFHQLAQVIETLNKASSPATAGTLESLRLLDPRFQMSFYAEELDSETGEVRDVLESSSGKSGGEKESFAGTIVAASLAYVLTPDGCDRPVYCTVFLDEAFSNTAEAVSRRVLRVFRELHIHINMITPYKNLNLARESARSLLIAERDPEKHDSRLCEVTWSEIDRKLAEEREESMGEEATRLGVSFSETPRSPMSA